MHLMEKSKFKFNTMILSAKNSHISTHLSIQRGIKMDKHHTSYARAIMWGHFFLFNKIEISSRALDKREYLMIVRENFC